VAKEGSPKPKHKLKISGRASPSGSQPRSKSQTRAGRETREPDRYGFTKKEKKKPPPKRPESIASQHSPVSETPSEKETREFLQGLEEQRQKDNEQFKQLQQQLGAEEEEEEEENPEL